MTNWFTWLVNLVSTRPWLSHISCNETSCFVVVVLRRQHWMYCSCHWYCAYCKNWCSWWTCGGAGLPAHGTTVRTATPVLNVTHRAETAAQTATAPAGLEKVSAAAGLEKVSSSNKNSRRQLQKSSKALPSELRNDNVKGRPNKMSNESCGVTGPDRDVTKTNSKQRNDIAVDIRTPSQPPQQHLPTADVCQPNDDYCGRLSEPSSVHHELSYSHVKAEEFLRVSNLPICCK